MKKKEEIGYVIRFVLVGTLAVGIQYGTYYLLIQMLPHNWAYIIGYLVSFVCNYILTTTITFRTKASRKNGIGFVLCHVVNLTLQIFLLNAFLYLGLSKELAPFPVFAISVPINYWMVRRVMRMK